MYGALICLSLLSTNVEVAPARETIVLLDLQGEVELDDRRVLGQLIATELQRHEHLEVITEQEMQRALELEGNRVAMGCDKNDCLAEIAGAYDARLVLFGEVGRLGEVFVVTLNLYDSKIARSRARESVTTPDISKMPGLLQAVVPKLLGLGDKPAREPAPEAKPLSPRALWGGVAAGVGLIGAVGLGVGAAVADDAVDGNDLSSKDRDGVRTLGITALVGAVVFGAVAVAGGAMTVMGLME